MKLDRVIAVRNNKTVFRDGKRCVKIFSSDFAKSGVFAEALSHVRAEEKIDFVPKLLEVIRHDRKWAIVYDFVKGKTLLQWMQDEPEALSDQVASFVGVQAKLHRTEGAPMPEMKSAFFDAIRKAPLEPDLKCKLQNGLQKMQFSSLLCHLDFVPSNVILSEEGKAFVIDWASALSGEPLADAAATYLLMKIRKWNEFAELYRKRYLQKMKKSKKALEEWIPYAATYLMKFVNQAEREALLPYVESIENKGETK